MSADSICKIIQYVRQNAWETPDKWPFSTDITKKNYFQLDYTENIQVAETGVKLQFKNPIYKPDNPDISATHGKFLYLNAEVLIGNAFQNTKEGSNTNNIIIDPNLVELLIYAPGFNKRSAYFGARVPSFELPADYPNTINETLVEFQCPVYVPTAKTGDEYAKYQAVNVDYFNTHLPEITNYVKCISSKTEAPQPAEIRLTPNANVIPAITITRENFTLSLSHLSLDLQASTYNATYRADLIQLYKNNLGLYLNTTPAVIGQSVPAGNVFFSLSHSGDFGELLLKCYVNQNQYVKMLAPRTGIENYILDVFNYGTTGGFFQYSFRNADNTNFNSLYSFFESIKSTKSVYSSVFRLKIKSTTSDASIFNINEIFFTSYYAISGLIPADPAQVITLYMQSREKMFYSSWIDTFDNTGHIIEDNLDNKDPYPVRTVFRRHYVDGKKAISMYIQFDDNTEMLVSRRFLNSNENIENVKDNSILDFTKTDMYKNMLRNRLIDKYKKGGGGRGEKVPPAKLTASESI